MSAKNFNADSKNKKNDRLKDILLFVAIGLCLLLFLSSFGLCGKVGNVLAGFFFGLFGVIAYAFPILLLAGIFYVAVFYKMFYDNRNPAIFKMIYIFFFYIFFAAFIEIIINGNEYIGPAQAFQVGYDEKYGGGFFGGAIAAVLCGGFGELGALIIDIILLVIFLVLHVKKPGFGSLFDKLGNSSKDAVDRSKDNKRRELNRREVNRIKKQRDIDRDITNKDRTSRKVRGVDLSATSLRETEVKPNDTNNNNVNVADVDGMSEININMYDEVTDEEIEPTSVTRVPLKSDSKSTSMIHFAQDNNKEPEADTTFSNATDSSDSVSAALYNDNKETDNDVRNVPVDNNVNNTDVDNAINTPIDNNVLNTPVSNPSKPIDVNAKEDAKDDTAGKSLLSELNNKKNTKRSSSYKFPPLNLLDPPATGSKDSKAHINEQGNKLIHVLQIFGVEAQLSDITHGPTVTRYEIVPKMGTKVSKIVNLADDIKLNLAAQDIRIEAPIPGKSTVGIEVPNEKNSAVAFSDLMRDKKFKSAKSKVAFAAGRDIAGDIVIADIAKMPHMLIAGATGSGKSVCINTIIMSILYKASPDEVKLIMVDPKVVELSNYNGIPHLLIPVVTDPKKASQALNWAVSEMMNRYTKFEHARVRNIEGYNEKIAAGEVKVTGEDGEEVVVNEKMYQMVIIIDELADLMMVASNEVEAAICRIAQLARAAGIHLIVATQRPSADIVTGLIKANVPSRISFAVSSAIDSRVILDEVGAERLLGKGDMLYFPQGASGPVRVQGAWVSDDEIHRVTEYIINNNNFDNSESEEISEKINQTASAVSGAPSTEGNDADDKDQYFEQCGKLIIEKGKGSIGMLQRNFKIGFNRAARIMDQLEEMGVVGPEEGTKPRRVLVTIEEFEEMLKG
ncbi:MAG: DNA translocase FtsK [Lachnospiraceae bacterium]|nr:DNA translocase FtsK [Lachnospiraceae bacterium]